ncbi:twin-arginine translocation pathway signal [Cyanobium sp. HWJ4-Hawea]|uniref:twin-arginine translocation pathway signal n=1 Tax=Cyanobium sp. HWJ4-Hawea TaxID=2823713 RepID=UPI0020CF66FD|nr:twin-arginine translocation pathway signal [Cyanobium sp. HWJ4-Hawea]MCP9807844.1 twin-arginine translocation pathway signal [Cyanobium sp. HWJ4-Hawea]
MGFDLALSRRQLLRLGLGAGVSAALPGLLAACGTKAPQRLLAAEGGFPQAWSRQLPQGWQLQGVADPGQIDQRPAALWSLSDGWAAAIPRQRLEPFALPGALADLAPWAAPVSRLYSPADGAVYGFPWAYSPWVLLLRSRPDLVARSQEGWDLLLDPSLKGKLVLPSSPRVAMALVGNSLARVEALRRQALAYDERDGLNLLLSGAAEAAVTPLQRVIPLLRRDPRLAVIWPASGAPLTWQLLLRPRGATLPPEAWLKQLGQAPLLEKLLLQGWVPPLPLPQLGQALLGFPAAVARLLLPSEQLLERCWSLPPLDAQARLDLQTMWDAAAPPA